MLTEPFLEDVGDVKMIQWEGQGQGSRLCLHLQHKALY